MTSKHNDIARIVNNAEILSDPQTYECCLYDCDDLEGFHEIESEISELASQLPNNICVLDLPKIICGNKRTKVFGKATCPSTGGHLILHVSDDRSVIFEDVNDAMNHKFRPCSRCMPDEYNKWKQEKK